MNKHNRKVVDFSVSYSQYLDASGNLSLSLKQLSAKGISAELLIEFYRWMQFTRTFDCKTIALQRTGRLGTYASCLGQEAVGTAIGKALHSDDVFVQAYRETPALFIRGITPEEIMQYWGGDERGSDFAAAKQDMPYAVPIASQCCHAVGISYAMKLRNQKRATLVVCGDGATSKGDFYEALNAAGVWQLPLVFVVNNNQWAISVPRSAQSHCTTLAQKAIAGGLSCEQVDGNDVVACYLSMQQALERARQGQGPHLIEALTYRLSDHTTADDASRYRHDDAVAEAWQKEPILRLKNWLLKEKLLDQQGCEDIAQQCSDDIEQAVARYLALAPQPADSMFAYLYAQLPELYATQLAELRAKQDEEGES